jgi:hypothetical protein
MSILNAIFGTASEINPAELKKGTDIIGIQKLLATYLLT